MKTKNKPQPQPNPIIYDPLSVDARNITIEGIVESVVDHNILLGFAGRPNLFNINLYAENKDHNRIVSFTATADVNGITYSHTLEASALVLKTGPHREQDLVGLLCRYLQKKLMSYLLPPTKETGTNESQ